MKQAAVVRSWPREQFNVGRLVPRPRMLRRLIVPLALLALWQGVVELEIYTRGQLPAPLDVWAAVRQMAEADRLMIHLQASITRVLWGFGIGSLVAIAVGLVIGLSRQVEELFGPTIQAFRTIPSLAWVPLLLLWMGIGEEPKITLVAIGVFFPVYTNLVGGIRQIDRKLVEVGYAYGLRGLSLAREVMLPASLPSLMTGIRMGLAQGWLFLVAAELLASHQGLGFLLIDGQNTGRTDIILMSIIFLALIGKTTDWLLQLLERRMLRWSDTFQGAA